MLATRTSARRSSGATPEGANRCWKAIQYTVFIFLCFKSAAMQIKTTTSTSTLRKRKKEQIKKSPHPRLIRFDHHQV
jgi:hypothetical protein